MNRISVTLIAVLLPFIVFAKFIKLEGTVGGQYPIVMELEQHDDGMYSGRYAYKSTLQKNGDVPCSWLDINPSYEAPYSKWTIRDCNAIPQEEWFNIKFNGKTLSARMKNAKGKYYDISATVAGTSTGKEPLTQYFKTHIGDMVCDMRMFEVPKIQNRLWDMMGTDAFYTMIGLYQTQGPIEYTKGMFWGSGFKAHECCDPFTIWAYDNDTNKFYAYILLNGREYWYSESGTVPYKFRELVEFR